MTIANYVRAGIVGLALAGCLNELKLSEPKPAEYKKMPGIVNLPMASKYSQLYIHDEDGDGQADWLGKHLNVKYLATGYRPKKGITEERMRTLTPQMRAAASALLKANQDLALLIDQEEFRLQQETTSK